MIPLSDSEIRARRFPVKASVRYREMGSPQWHVGRTENLSCSGALIASRHRVAPTVPVELLLPIPREITGKARVEVLCSGPVVRVVNPHLPLFRSTFAVRLRQIQLLEANGKTHTAKLRSGAGTQDWRALLHDMYNEIAIVVGNSELLLDPDGEKTRHRVSNIKRSAARLVSLVQRLNDTLRNHS